MGLGVLGFRVIGPRVQGSRSSVLVFGFGCSGRLLVALEGLPRRLRA